MCPALDKITESSSEGLSPAQASQTLPALSISQKLHLKQNRQRRRETGRWFDDFDDALLPGTEEESGTSARHGLWLGDVGGWGRGQREEIRALLGFPFDTPWLSGLASS